MERIAAITSPTGERVEYALPTTPEVLPWSPNRAGTMLLISQLMHTHGVTPVLGMTVSIPGWGCWEVTLSDTGVPYLIPQAN